MVQVHFILVSWFIYLNILVPFLQNNTRTQGTDIGFKQHWNGVNLLSDSQLSSKGILAALGALKNRMYNVHLVTQTLNFPRSPNQNSHVKIILHKISQDVPLVARKVQITPISSPHK